MKVLPTLFIMFGFITIQAQVGILESDPKEDLHLGGTNSTIRIEGLNNANHANNPGGAYMGNLVVDNSGDIDVSRAQVEILLDEVNTASSTQIQTTSNAGYRSEEIYLRTFTLTERAIVYIDYTVSCDLFNTDGVSAKDDDRTKLAMSYYYLGDGVTANTSHTYGSTQSIYTNGDVNTVTGKIYNSASAMHILEAGTYSVHLTGAVFGGGLDANADFRVTFANEESITVIANYF